jgi:hypothetical protein
MIAQQTNPCLTCAPVQAVINELARESGDAPDAAYGLRQSLATGGMLLGSTIAAVVFAASVGAMMDDEWFL